MWGELRRKISRLLYGAYAADEHSEKLVEARAKLEEEASALQKDIGKVGDRPDPIGTIIRNIRQVRGRQ